MSVPENNENSPKPPPEPRRKKLRKIASTVAVVSNAVYQLVRVLNWLRNWTV